MTSILAGKIIVVAGAGGIGDALATRYAGDGARVVVGDLDGDHATELASRIDPTGERVVGTGLDGTDEESVAALVALAMSRYGALHGFHANFANFADGLSTAGVDLPLEDFDQVMNVNARGYFLCSRHAVPAIVESGGGSIVYTSSAAAHMPSPVRVAYAMSKAAVHALMRTVATRYGPKGVRANAITPGLILHDRLPELPESLVASAKATTPIKSRLGMPEDIAAMGSFLMSDDAGYLTGQVIAVDGGGSMRP
ncbi:SDR family NAD(P)-dependent oxidoreductase [Mycolicibacterium mengxianglii]|uniref:SDR family NAD(P)-dependent oxidoreductase n=1 Tax=Mycolicibacterium mengxianglii TaxID=2736649 RepID=UPI0018EEF587|nr:SDR family NAD(P)-dependent oxidoreductase [Mycolicibacterium mengxianglii]